MARHDPLQDGAPPIGAVNVAAAQSAALQFAEQIEREERVKLGAFIMAVPDAHLVFAVCRADAPIRIKRDASRRTDTVNMVDPSARRIGQRRQVLFGHQPARLEMPHLTRQHRVSGGRLPADAPTYRRIMAQPLDVIQMRVAGKPPPKTVCRDLPAKSCRPFLPARASASLSPAIALW